MRKISIITPQNVMIELDSAGFLMRVLAFAIDVIVKIVMVIFLNIAFSFMNLDPNVQMIFIYFTFIPVIFFYTFLFELFLHGQTPGKMMTGIFVRMEDGSEIGTDACFTRWFLRVIDIYVTIGALAGMLINASEKEQRLGDMMAGTIVTRKLKMSGISLKAIEDLQQNENYEPKYPQMVNLKEEDVLLIKNTVLRYERYRNTAHTESLKVLTAHIYKLLGLPEKPSRLDSNKIDFLRTCVKDYIILTR